MLNSTVSNTKIGTLAHPIGALDDRPALSAADLKAYFDANPQQLCDAHNQLVHALTDAQAAGGIGFTSSADILADNVQDAIEGVQGQLKDISLGVVPDGSIDTQKLSGEIQNEIKRIESLSTIVTELQKCVKNIHPSGTQFPLMVIALSEGCPETSKDEIATAAFGLRMGDEMHDLGIQLRWLCRFHNDPLPSEAFCAKQTINKIFSDASTLREVEKLTCIRTLISYSAEVSHMYRMALDQLLPQ